MLQEGLTPLHLAAYDDRLEVAQLLIKAGANVAAEDKVRYCRPCWGEGARLPLSALRAAAGTVSPALARVLWLLGPGQAMGLPRTKLPCYSAGSVCFCHCIARPDKIPVRASPHALEPGWSAELDFLPRRPDPSSCHPAWDLPPRTRSKASRPCTSRVAAWPTCLQQRAGKPERHGRSLDP